MTNETLVLILLLPGIVIAQATAPLDARKGHGFVSAGFLSATDDSAQRTPCPDATGVTGAPWVVAAAVFVVNHVAIGVEGLPLGTAAGACNALSFDLSDEEREMGILGTVRWRAPLRNRIAVDVVGGVGDVFQHRMTRTRSHFFPPSSEISTIDDQHSLVVSVGVDAPISVVSHIVVSPLIRVYVVERAEQLNLHVAPSNRFAAGVSVGANW